MARAARKTKEDDVGLVQTKDFARARNLYFGDIKPAKTKAAEYMQEGSTAYKLVKKECNIQPSAMKAAIKVIELEDAKRDDWLRCFNGFLRENGVDPDPKDLVDAMRGGDNYARPKPTLVTLGEPSDGMETDLADAASGAFTEATDEELAQQEGRNEGVTQD